MRSRFLFFMFLCCISMAQSAHSMYDIFEDEASESSIDLEEIVVDDEPAQQEESAPAAALDKPPMGLRQKLLLSAIFTGLALMAGGAAGYELVRHSGWAIIPMGIGIPLSLIPLCFYIAKSPQSDTTLSLEHRMAHAAIDKNTNYARKLLFDTNAFQLAPLERRTHITNSKRLITTLCIFKQRTVPRDIRQKILAECPDLICNKKMFNLFIPKLFGEEESLEALVRLCPLDWFTHYYHTQCRENQKELFALTSAATMARAEKDDKLEMVKRHKAFKIGNHALYEHLHQHYHKQITQ